MAPKRILYHIFDLIAMKKWSRKKHSKYLEYATVDSWDVEFNISEEISNQF